MKYGLVCKICDRLLWVGKAKPRHGDAVPPEGWVHAVTGKPRSEEPIQWCGCKGKVAYTELTEPR